MDGRRIRSFVVFVTFLGFAACCSGGNRKIAQVFVSNAVPINLIDEDTAEQIWTYCKTELKELTQGIKNFEWHEKINSNYDTNTIESAVAWFARKRLQRTISNLPHPVKQTLLDCVKKKTKPSQDSMGESGSSNWLIKYRLLVSNWSTLSRRYLLRKSRQRLTSSPVNAADNARESFTAAIRAADVADAPTQKMMAKSPAAAEVDPASSATPVTPDSPPPPRTLPDYILLPFLPGVDVPPAMTQGNPGGNTGGNAGGHSASHMVLVYAVIGMGCLAAFLLVALILVCFFKRKYKKEVEQRNARRDDKPLSDVGSSDTSTGSTRIINTPGRRAKKKSFRPPVSPGNITIGKSKTKMVQKSTNSESQSPESSTANPPEGGDSIIEGSELPSPPGKVVAPPPPSDAGPTPSAPPPPPPKVPAGPRPPPPPKAGTPARPAPLAPSPHFRNPSDANAPKSKLKPFFWDKVLANPDHSMVWHDIRGGSFQVDEEMIESLFGVSAAERNKLDHKKETTPFEVPNQYVQIIDPKKAQNLSILLKALNVTTEEVCDAIKEGHELPPELVQTLLRMAPTSDEELKLRLYSGDLSQLGPAERFLKVLVDIPYAFKRLESLLFMSFLQEELSSLKESFATLEVACKELTKSRLFLKLLEAVLKTGNRMNDGTFRGGAQAFKLDTLLKLSDVKGTDGKTTLLHFVVQEIIRSEGVRAARKAKEAREAPPEDSTEEEVADYYRGLGLKVVSGLSNELVHVRKAALIDGDVLTSTVSKLGHSLAKSREFLNGEMQTVVESTKFRETLTSFIQNAEVDVMWLLEEEKRMMAQVRSTADYFHGQAGKDEGLRLFVIVRDFLIILDKVCREVRSTSLAAAARTPLRNTSSEASPSSSTSGESHRRSNSDADRLLFPTIKEPEAEEKDDFTSSSSSSDEETTKE